MIAALAIPDGVVEEAEDGPAPVEGMAVRCAWERKRAAKWRHTACARRDR